MMVGPGSEHRDRLSHNAYALVASSAITSLVGVAFWLVAARRFDPAEVGKGSALITSLALLGNLSCLGMRNTLIRFIPAAGTRSTRFVVTGYAVCSAAAVVAAVAFLIGLPLWAEELTFLRHDAASIGFFVVATIGWTLFILQDNVLTGLRVATWIPFENAAYSIAKLAALAAFGGVGAWVIGLAWVLPALVTLFPMSWLIRGRLRALRREGRPPASGWSARGIRRFAAGDQASDVLRILGAELVVLIVLGYRGAEASASFFLAATIAASLANFGSNIASAFVAETATRPGDEEVLLRRAAAHAARLVVPTALATAALAPTIMKLFGARFASDGAAALRVLAIGVIAQTVVALGVGVARVHRRVGLVIVLFGAAALGPLIGALGVRQWGLTGIAVFSVVGQTVVAAALLATLLRPVWVHALGGRWAAALVHARDRIRQGRRVRAAASVLDELDSGRNPDDRLIPRRVLRSDNDTIIAMVERPHDPCVVKIALSDAAAAGLERHAEAIEALHREIDDEVLGHVPRVVQRGTCLGHSFLVESAFAGHVPLATDHHTITASLAAIRAIHGATAVHDSFDESLLQAMVDDPIDVLRSDPRLAVHKHAIEHLRSELRAMLAGHPVRTCRTHGDCWPGNFLFDSNGGSTHLTGIVDWEDSSPRGVPDVDLVHHWLSVQPDGLAAAVRHGLGARQLVDLLGAAAPPSIQPAPPVHAVVLLAWLAHVAAGLRRATRFPLSSTWVDRNVVSVLRITSALVGLPAGQPHPSAVSLSHG